jgi:hypothetical protein
MILTDLFELQQRILIINHTALIDVCINILLLIFILVQNE